MKSLYHLRQVIRKVVVERKLLTPHYRLMERLIPVMLEVPEGKEKGVVLSFDLETFPDAHGDAYRAGEESEAFMLSLLKTLDSYPVKAQFFVCGRTIELNPGLLCSIVQRGHGLGGHGYMHERMPSLSYGEQREVMSKVKAIAKRFLGVELISWRSPFLASNFGTYKALRESGFRISSSAMGASRPFRIKDIIEVPSVPMDVNVLGHSSPKSYEIWVEFMKRAFGKLDKGFLVFGMHPRFQMDYDPKLRGLEEFLSWLEPFREESWVGNLNDVIAIPMFRL